ncbi:MAG: hypothetical protein ACK56I_08105, partial [bacterium]
DHNPAAPAEHPAGRPRQRRQPGRAHSSTSHLAFPIPRAWVNGQPRGRAAYSALKWACWRLWSTSGAG